MIPAARSKLLDDLVPLIHQAGDAVMAIYATDFAVTGKADASPVTEADRRAEDIITAGLVRLTPDIPVVGEEAEAEGRAPPRSASASGWSIRWTAPRNSSAATVSSPSTSP